MAIIAKLLMLTALGFTGYALYRMVEAWVQGRGKELIEELDQEAEQLQELAMAKARTLRDIRDLEFDFQTGHIAQDEYKALRARLERRGRSILKRLDELRGEVDYDDLIDRELDARVPGIVRATAAPVVVEAGAPCTGCGVSLAAGDRFCAGCGTAVPEREGCAACGAGLDVDARFCTECGEPTRAADSGKQPADRPRLEVQA